MKKEYTYEAYEELIALLFTRFPSFQKQGAAAYKPGLERMMEICRRMGEPQKSFRSIHVAGTNGKGSTCNMLAAQLASSGLKTGLYTSPHILDFRERMRVIPAMPKTTIPGSVQESFPTLISREKIWDLLQEYDADFRELDLSFFEITTALAFKFFADEKVDIAVIETGLGGRLDATNVIIPELSVITNIGLDHTDLLGSTLPLIAAEKAGIIKPGIPVVIGESAPSTDAVFRSAAEASGSPIFFAETLSFNVEDPHSELKFILENMDLKGCYQEKNVRTVMAAIAVLGLKPDFEAIANAAHICDFHGRWEIVGYNPYTICDIGHNEHGLKYNFAQLDAMLDGGQFSDLVMVYGSVADKDVDAVLNIIPSRAHIVFTAADSHRAMPATALAERFQSIRPDASDFCVCPAVPDAVKRAIELCRTLKNPILYIGGSTYVVSEACTLDTGSPKPSKSDVRVKGCKPRPITIPKTA